MSLIHKLAFLALLLLLPLPALAGTLALTATTATGTTTTSATIPDADLTRLLADHKALQGEHLKRGVAAPTTDAQVLQGMMNDVVKRAVQRATGYERSQAARSAMTKVAPIAVAPAQ